MELGSWVILGTRGLADVGNETRKIVEDPFCQNLKKWGDKGQRLVYSNGRISAALTQDFASSRQADVVVVRFEGLDIFYVFFRNEDSTVVAGLKQQYGKPALSLPLTTPVGVIPKKTIHCFCWGDESLRYDALKIAMVNLGLESMLQSGDEI